MERAKASDFPQEVLNIFDLYIHGQIDRRGFLDRAQKYAVGGLTAAAMLELLRPNWALGQQVPKDDARLRITLSENGQQVWLGFARVVKEMTSGGAAYGVIEGSSQASDITNRVTDELVADLMLQMQRSVELRTFLEGKKT